MMHDLIFEKVGDINSTYPYLCVYLQGDAEPFMEIAVTDERKLEFTFYARKLNVVLGVENINEILHRAQFFLPQALENEGFV